MSTALRIEPPDRLHLGPRDHGLELTYDAFMAADYEEGYQYEIIDGRLHVSPMPNFSDDWYERFINKRLEAWAELHPEVIGWVARKSRVFVRRRRKTTAPEPDLAAFREKPAGPDADWRNLSPLIVVEVMKEDWKKDLVRNVELYGEIPSIFEYWVIDIRDDIHSPTLRVFRRDSGDQPWTPAEYPADARYTTPLLPGFELPVTPQW